MPASTKYDNIDWSLVNHIADILLGVRNDHPRPIYTPLEVKPPKGFEPKENNGQ